VVPARAKAQAFPASGEEVIHAMHDRYADSWYRAATFWQKVTRHGRGDSVTVETWRGAALVPGRLRIDVKGASPPRTYLHVGDSLFVISGDSVTRVAEHSFLAAISRDVYRQAPDKTLAALRAEQFAMTPVYGTAWSGREVYVIGAAKGDLHAPQLWIDRDRLLFLRAFAPNTRDNTKTDEYRFEDYTLQPGGWMPRRVVKLTDGREVERADIWGVELNGRLDAKTFAPPK